MKERELLNSSTIVFQQIKTSERLGLFRCPIFCSEFARQKSKMPDNHDYQAFPVPRPGIEPGWILLHWCLRPARLPIPPSGLLRCKVIQTIWLMQIFNHFFIPFAQDAAKMPHTTLRRIAPSNRSVNHFLIGNACNTIYFCTPVKYGLI